MLLETLKSANIQAMKDRDAEKRAILSVVLTKCKLQEVEMRSKGSEFSDADVLSIIQKTLKELSDEKEGYQKVNNLDRVASIEKQIEVISAYLPKQLSKDEILAEINTLADKSMPSIMKHFKANFAGKVDMSLVSQIARTL